MSSAASSCAAAISVLLAGLLRIAGAQPIGTSATGEVLELRDPRTSTTVSIVPSVGNVSFSMKVNGHELLYWPYSSIADFRAKPALSGIPLLAPWANRLDEEAFYANGKRYAFDMALGNVRSPIPIHG